jgi:hypothetical protein
MIAVACGLSAHSRLAHESEWTYIDEVDEGIANAVNVRNVSNLGRKSHHILAVIGKVWQTKLACEMCR